ncbi:MAG: TolC family protein, partial [Magnetococcales bacterium]|nr:TolC family protein [Magnetococcales bacterium]
GSGVASAVDDGAEKDRPRGGPTREAASQLSEVDPARVGKASAEEPVVPGKTPLSPEPLSLKSFIDLIYDADENIMVQRLEEEIAGEKIVGAESMFEPSVAISTNREGSYVLNSSNEILQRSNQAQYRSDVDQYNTALGMKVPTGGDVELSYNVSRSINSLQKVVDSASPEYKAYVGAKVTHPLLRGAGYDVTMSPIRLAEQEQAIARETVRQVLTQRVMEGIVVYFNAQRARERMRLRGESLALVDRLLAEVRQQERRGLKSSGDLMEAASLVAQRRASFSQAQQDLEEQMNSLQALISVRARERGRDFGPRSYRVADSLELLATPVKISAEGGGEETPAGEAAGGSGTPPATADSPGGASATAAPAATAGGEPVATGATSGEGASSAGGSEIGSLGIWAPPTGGGGEPRWLTEVLTESLSSRPENRINQIRVDREEVQVDLARNQALPEMNMVARYGYEDLNTVSEYRPFDSYFRDVRVPYSSWMVGLQFKMGIFGDEKKESELEAARLRRRQVELAQSAVQQRIANEMMSSASILDKALRQVKEHRQTVEAQKRLVAIDENLVKEGNRSSIDLMRKQLDLLVAEEALVDSIVLANRASFIVSQAQGTVLSRLGLE